MTANASVTLNAKVIRWCGKNNAIPSMSPPVLYIKWRRKAGRRRTLI